MREQSIVSFDVFGTLIDIVEDKERPEAYAGLARWLGYHGVRLDGAALQQQVQLLTDEQLRRNPQPHPDVDIERILRQSVDALSPGTPLTEALLPEACRVLRTLTTVSLSAVPQAREVLLALAPTHRLGVCSNTQRAYTLGELRMFDLLTPLEHIVFSSDVLACKPNVLIFQELLRQFEQPPGRFIHVGDRLLDDVAAAASLGMRTIWIRRHPSLATTAPVPTPAARPDRTVDHLAEVPAAVRSLTQD